jgi:hypothetical protein
VSRKTSEVFETSEVGNPDLAAEALPLTQGVPYGEKALPASAARFRGAAHVILF